MNPLLKHYQTKKQKTLILKNKYKDWKNAAFDLLIISFSVFQWWLRQERSRDKQIWRRVSERLPECDRLRAEEARGGGAGEEARDFAQRSYWTQSR